MPLILFLLVVSVSSFLSARALADITELLGQDDVSDFASQMGCVRKDIKRFKCMDTGVEFKMDYPGTVQSLWLYAEGVDGYRAFRWQIPLGLAWGMTPQQVVERLGQPHNVVGNRFQYRFTNLPFNVELLFNPGLGRALFTER